MHLFGHTLDHDYYFELPGEGERDTQSISRCLPHTIAMSGLSRVRTELFQLLIIPSLAPHPVLENRQSPRHSDLGDLSPPPHRQVEILTTPFLVAAHRDLRRFHQQETQQRVVASHNDHCSAPFSRALVGWHHQSLLGLGEPTLSWNQLHSEP